MVLSANVVGAHPRPTSPAQGATFVNLLAAVDKLMVDENKKPGANRFDKFVVLWKSVGALGEKAIAISDTGFIFLISKANEEYSITQRGQVQIDSANATQRSATVKVTTCQKPAVCKTLVVGVELIVNTKWWSIIDSTRLTGNTWTRVNYDLAVEGIRGIIFPKSNLRNA